jgi:putative membrane protein
MFDYGLAVAHHLLVFSLFGILFAELVLVMTGPERQAVVLVGRIDLWYGLLAGLILFVGFVRAIVAAKGWTYYEHNLFFWAKIATFAVIGLLSVPPTILFIGWRRPGQAPAPRQIRLVRRLLWTELALFALLPIFAAAMARGYGEFGI